MRLTTIMSYVAALRYAIFPSEGVNEDRWCRICSKGFRSWLGLALHLEAHSDEELQGIPFFVSGDQDQSKD